MKIVGHTSAAMWKRYNAVQEADLLKAAQTLHGYLQSVETDTVMTLDESSPAQ